MATKTNSLLMISGPSGIGKTTLVSSLISRWPKSYIRPISLTSRAKRSGEDGSEYSFVDRKTIMHEFERGNLANLDTVYGNVYAIQKSSIDDALQKGISPIKEIHPTNHYKLRNLYPCSVAVLVLPDNGFQNNSYHDARQQEDAEFYSKVDLDDFDIITRTSRTSGIDAFVEDAHWAIQSYLAGRDRFPSPCLIDKTNADGYGKVAGRFTTEERPTTANFHDLSAPFFAEAISKLPDGSRCLEVGPGQGWLRKSFDWPPVHYSALDLAAGMISTLDFETTAAEKVSASARAMPFSSGSFDRVFASLGDGYCYPTALAEIRRVLKKNGHFYFTAPSRVWADGLRNSSASNKTQFLLPDGSAAEVFSFALSTEELEKVFSQCGFRLNSIEVVHGDKLPPGSMISNALIESARRLNIALDSLPIINTISAIKN